MADGVCLSMSDQRCRHSWKMASEGFVRISALDDKVSFSEDSCEGAGMLGK